LKILTERILSHNSGKPGAYLRFGDPRELELELELKLELKLELELELELEPEPARK